MVQGRFYSDKVVQAALRVPGVLDVVDRLVTDEDPATPIPAETARASGDSDTGDEGEQLERHSGR